MNRRMFDLLEKTGGMSISLYRDVGPQMNLRSAEKSGAAPFAAELVRKAGDK